VRLIYRWLKPTVIENNPEQIKVKARSNSNRYLTKKLFNLDMLIISKNNI
jgi:hypothetical protein